MANMTYTFNYKNAELTINLKLINVNEFDVIKKINSMDVEIHYNGKKNVMLLSENEILTLTSMERMNSILENRLLDEVVDDKFYNIVSNYVNNQNKIKIDDEIEPGKVINHINGRLKILNIYQQGVSDTNIYCDVKMMDTGDEFSVGLGAILNNTYINRIERKRKNNKKPYIDSNNAHYELWLKMVDTTNNAVHKRTHVRKNLCDEWRNSFKPFNDWMQDKELLELVLPQNVTTLNEDGNITPETAIVLPHEVNNIVQNKLSALRKINISKIPCTTYRNYRYRVSFSIAGQYITIYTNNVINTWGLWKLLNDRCFKMIFEELYKHKFINSHSKDLLMKSILCNHPIHPMYEGAYFNILENGIMRNRKLTTVNELEKELLKPVVELLIKKLYGKSFK